MGANRVKAYFYFTKKERLGISLFLAGAVLLWFAPVLMTADHLLDEEAYNRFRSDIEQLQQTNARAPARKEASGFSFSDLAAAPRIGNSSATLFYFDPNTLPVEQWQRLGLSARTAQTIQNYLTRGGRFYRPEDIGRIYGLKKQEYNRLLPYVRIAEVKAAERSLGEEKSIATEQNPQKREIGKLSVNSADSAAFVSLPGIGEKLAGRIIKFRNQLGGFYTADQISEVYGISDSVFRKIKPYLQCDSGQIKKININTADIAALKAHPYIKYKIGNAVIQYRMQHGSFENPEELKKIHLISDTLLGKLKPYLKN